MNNEIKSINFKAIINSAPETAYYSFTNAEGFRGWLCDESQVDPRPGGRLYLWWQSGYYVSGVFVTLVPGRSVTFTWFGREEPGETQVQVNFLPTEGGTQVELTHFGLGLNEGWEEVAAEYKKGWGKGLENLQSVLEKGQDLRIVRRPVLGVRAGGIVPPSPEGVARVSHQGGIRIDGVLPDTGAAAAGLQSEDVLVSLGGQPVPTFADLSQVLDQFYAGDTVAVEVVRSGEEISLEMTLSPRTLPLVPGTPEEFAKSLHAVNTSAYEKVHTQLKDVTDPEAEFTPGRGTWNVKQNLAHLILVERDNQGWIAAAISDQEASFNSNETVRLNAVIESHPSLAHLFAEWKQAIHETEAMIQALPKPFVLHRKGGYMKLGYGLLTIQLHTDQHLEQMAGLVAKARG